MNKANECTCPSGDGSLVHPCPAHPAVEQAGGDERAAFKTAYLAEFDCDADGDDNMAHSNTAWRAWKMARAALAQPSPAGEYGDAYQGAREDIAIWKRRALEAEQALRQAHNGQTFMGEPLVQPYEAPREKVNALFKVLGFSGTASVGDILDAALERLQAQPSPALPPFAEKVLAKLRRFYDCASDFESGGVDIGRHWLDLLTQLGLLNRVQRSPALWEISQQGEDLLGMPQPSPAQAEAERPEVAEVAFVLRNIGAMDAEDIDGDNVDLRFEDAEGRDTGCDVSIVEYAEKAADLFEQHDRIVGELRADRDSWAEQAEQRLADWDEMRKERDAAQARVAELEAELADAHASAEREEVRANGYSQRLAELEKQEPVAWTWQGVIDQLRRGDYLPEGVTVFPHRGPGVPLPLYAAPASQAGQVPEGYMVLQTASLSHVLGLVEGAMEDAYGNAFQVCCGKGRGGECCGDPEAGWSPEDQRTMDVLNPIQRELRAMLAAASAQGGV
ncbi:hypothetical protein [Pseudomonas aeruginosa]|uniref:hypothetical protein n=1 Tax=Pseudomonas aeruginosa TaxID=287 RepID=UPI0009A74552|nr:hypothetical protein [Pseudomonas aeruginosa]